MYFLIKLPSQCQLLYQLVNDWGTLNLNWGRGMFKAGDCTGLSPFDSCGLSNVMNYDNLSTTSLYCVIQLSQVENFMGRVNVYFYSNSNKMIKVYYSWIISSKSLWSTIQHLFTVKGRFIVWKWKKYWLKFLANIPSQMGNRSELSRKRMGNRPDREILSAPPGPWSFTDII